MKVGKYNIPFYISTGQAGKKTVKAGNWYAVFGIGVEKGWINKGSEEEINNNYGFQLFEKLSKILNEGIGVIESREDNGNGKLKEGIGFLSDSKQDLEAFNNNMNLPTKPAGKNTDTKDFYDHVNSTLSLLNNELKELDALKTNVVPENAESSDDVESPAVESGQKTINTDDPNRYTVEKLKIDLEKVTNKKEYEIFLIDIFRPNIQNMIVDDVAEMSSLMKSKINSFENLNDIKIDIKKLEKESQIVSKVDIITPNKSNFSANFTFVVTKVDDNNKVVTIKPLGSEELISLSFDDIANKFDLKETIENSTESSKETLNDEVKEYVNETNDVLDAFLVNKKQIDKIIEDVSSKKIKDIDKALLDNLYC